MTKSPKRKPATKNQTERLIRVLEAVEHDLNKQNSLKRSLLKGMVYGIGTVIGASVLVALFGGLFASVVGFVDEDADTQQIENLFDQS